MTKIVKFIYVMIIFIFYLLLVSMKIDGKTFLSFSSFLI